MSGDPLLITGDGAALKLTRMRLSGQDVAYNEHFIQKLAFENPSCLPISEIDRAFEQPIPICMELNTAAGPIDALYITPTGRLILVEAKLWKNPEARRKVIGQILDYAKELSRWDYEDLQREVARKVGGSGNVPFELVRKAYPDLDEARFVDDVQESLSRGRYLLMILGDGIRRKAAAIAGFIESVGSLEFTFGLVELGLYEHEQVGLLVQPRVIAKTVELKRVVVQLPAEAELVEETGDGEKSQEYSKLQKFYVGFWSELLDELDLDDKSQPIPKPYRLEIQSLAMPPSASVAWVNAYFAKSSGIVGVYLRLSKTFGDEAYERLQESRDEIESDLGLDDIGWSSRDGKHTIAHQIPMADPFDASKRDEIKAYFKDTLNRFVNTFRHRLDSISTEMDG